MKYIIIDPEDGVFLGTAGRHQIGHLEMDIPPEARTIALFSSNNVFDITKAAAFFDEEEAKQYLRQYIGRRFPKAFIAKINVPTDFNPYVDVVDIVKSGYGQYALDMIDAMPMDNQNIH